ncbi:MAG: ThuA domain-containing protein [Gemmataceae bacterium]
MTLPRALLLALVAITGTASAADPWVTLPGGDGIGKGKHVVFVSGDEEYRSEEALPALAKILSKHHGFKCTVLFAIDPKDGTVNPNVNNNIPGLEHLKDADLAVFSLRFRDLPDAQMKHVVEYVESGKPVVGLRTSTHAFNLTSKTHGKYTHNSRAKGYEGGFGKQVLGETWVDHYGAHAKEGTRGVVATGQQKHPILKGIEPGDIFGTSDVYEVKLPLPGDSQPLVYGEVTETLEPDSKAVVEGPNAKKKKNSVKMPVAWTKTYQTEGGKTARVFTTTMGASHDLQWEGTRRLIVNGCLWALGLEDKIPAKTNVDLVGQFKPTMFRFKKNEEWKPGKLPEDYFK